jgi:DNA processing protein
LEDDLQAQTEANESSSGVTASLFTGQLPQPQLTSHEQLVIEQLRQDESLQLDDLIERLEPRLTSSEIFTALFELELSGRIRQMPGKNYLRSF